MEIGRRSLSSENDFRERRRRRSKKKGALPLAMMLSFNDKDVHPDCPNASNPYHKCGLHCLHEIPSAKNLLDAVRSDGDRKWEKKSEKNVLNPNCPHASNPYHECAEYCLEKLSEKRQDAIKDQPEKPKGISNKTNKSSVHLNRNASSHKKVTEYCFEDTPKKEHLKADTKPKKENEIDVTTQQGFSSECKNASNPHHVCVEYCFQSVPEREQHGQVIRLKSSKEGEKVMSNIESAENSEGVSMETDKFVHSSRKHASSPYNKVTEYYFEDTSEKEHPEGAVKPKEEGEIVVIAEQGVNLERRSASNPDHVKKRRYSTIDIEHVWILGGNMHPTLTISALNLLPNYATKES